MVSSHIPFHQKYRPTNLDELVGQEVKSITLKQALLTNKIAPAYLFSGPRGTGKTSSARIFAKSLNCLSFDEPNTIPCGQCSLCKDISQGNALDILSDIFCYFAGNPLEFKRNCSNILGEILEHLKGNHLISFIRNLGSFTFIPSLLKVGIKISEC